MTHVKQYIERHFRHFNAAIVVDAARAWEAHLASGGKMLVTMGGAMSTAELGLVLAELIRADKVHALCVTGANLEEDLFNLVAHSRYKRIPHFRELSANDDQALLQANLNRVTDTCIPEEEAMRKVERHMLEVWRAAERSGQRSFPHEYLYQVIDSGVLAGEYQIDPRDSWLVEACKKKLPLWVPGWEDSTLGNMLVAYKLLGDVGGYSFVKGGLEAFENLVEWYRETDASTSIGLFQIAGGISGDFPICAVPTIRQDLRAPCRPWGYFCQISDSTTSYGSYSGAPPNEKISWGKLTPDTPRFMIESDATIVFPLIAANLLDR